MTARPSRRLVARIDPRRRVKAAVTLSGRGREGVVQAGKMAVAAVVAWLVALSFDRTQPFIAAYAAVFMMSGTVYRSLVDAARQVTTVILGVLVAFGAGLVLPWQPVVLGVAVFVGMVIGRWHRLGRDGIWVGVIALLMVTYGAADDTSYLVVRVAEVLLGAVVGVAVNALVLPPLTLRDAGRGVAAVSGEIAELLGSIREGLRGGWDESDARRWRRSGRALSTAVRHAEEAVGHGQESMWLNSRRLWKHAERPVVEQRALHTLYEVTQQIQQLTEVLVTSAEPDNDLPTTGTAFNTQLATLLDTLTDAVLVFRDPHTRSLDRQALDTALDRARNRRAALAGLVPWPDLEPPRDWSTHAAAMLAVERALRTLRDAADDS